MVSASVTTKTHFECIQTNHYAWWDKIIWFRDVAQYHINGIIVGCLPHILRRMDMCISQGLSCIYHPKCNVLIVATVVGAAIWIRYEILSVCLFRQLKKGKHQKTKKKKKK